MRLLDDFSHVETSVDILPVMSPWIVARTWHTSIYRFTLINMYAAAFSFGNVSQLQQNSFSGKMNAHKKCFNFDFFKIRFLWGQFLNCCKFPIIYSWIKISWEFQNEWLKFFFLFRFLFGKSNGNFRLL